MQTNPSIKNAILTLRNNLDQIHTVAEWADYMDYSRAYFSTLIKEEFSQQPSRIIRREKYKKVWALVREQPDRKGQVIARKTGFSNVKSLYKFLRRHYDITLTAMRKRAKSNR